LSFWSTGNKTPAKFYIPEYKIEEFKLILSSLKDLKDDERYVRDGELTEKGKPSFLYYRLTLANKKYIDVYFVESDYNGDKSINIAIESESKVYPMYDSNVTSLIDVIPTPADIAKYKQSAAELYYLKTYVLGNVNVADNSDRPVPFKKKAQPRTVTKVDRTSVPRPDIETLTKEEKIEQVIQEKTLVDETGPSDNLKSETVTEAKPSYDYNNLLEDE
jgi:hypothetical protein